MQIRLGHETLLILALAASSASSAIVVGPWNPIYRGVDHAIGSADAAEGVLQQVNALRIDLWTPDIAFLTTPSNGGDPEETNAQTASDFLTDHGLQVAINANFFDPAALFQSDGQPKDLEGLAISQGTLVSPQETDPVVRRGQVLLIDQENVARFDNTTSNPIDLTSVYNAVAGDVRVLSLGNPGVAPGGERHPRTAIGLSQEDRYLVMLTIDGRQPGLSDGATYFEISQWLTRFGAYDGIALDGGGSTTMVRSDGQEGATVLNSPVGAGLFGNSSGERFNGNHLGVLAQPLPPQPGDFNEDRNVDQVDLSYWQSGFGIAADAELGDGDADTDGDVDGDDFLIWQANVMATSASAHRMSIPEPSSLVLLLLSALGGTLCRNTSSL